MMYPSEREQREWQWRRRERRRRTCEMCGGDCSPGAQYCGGCTALLDRAAALDKKLKVHEKRYISTTRKNLMTIVAASDV